MENSIDFIAIAVLIGEQARAKMLWQLLDGRAYTASELAVFADISSTSASNHLTKLLEAGLLKVEIQGRYRYYSFSRPEVAYAIEALANLVVQRKDNSVDNESLSGVRYCRSCYDHLAGRVGVAITQTMVDRQILEVLPVDYQLTSQGWVWLEKIGVSKEDFVNSKRSFARQCLDWSERKPHLAGHLGALLFKKMVEMDWVRKKQFSREVIITIQGQRKLHELLGIHV